MEEYNRMVKIEITPVCDEKKCKYKFQVDDSEPEIISKVAVRLRLGQCINKLGKRRLE